MREKQQDQKLRANSSVHPKCTSKHNRLKVAVKPVAETRTDPYEGER